MIAEVVFGIKNLSGATGIMLELDRIMLTLPSVMEPLNHQGSIDQLLLREAENLAYLVGGSVEKNEHDFEGYAVIIGSCRLKVVHEQVRPMARQDGASHIMSRLTGTSIVYGLLKVRGPEGANTAHIMDALAELGYATLKQE